MFPRMPKILSLGWVRSLVVGLVSLLFLTSATTVYAAGVNYDDAGPMPDDKICIEGSLISHDEHPLGDGWIIGATPRDRKSVV